MIPLKWLGFWKITTRCPWKKRLLLWCFAIHQILLPSMRSKLKATTIKRILRLSGRAMETYFPGNPMDYFFLDKFLTRQYESDRQFWSGVQHFQPACHFYCLFRFVWTGFVYDHSADERNRYPEGVGFHVQQKSFAVIERIYPTGFSGQSHRLAFGLGCWGSWIHASSFSYHIDIKPCFYLLSQGGCGGDCFPFVGFQTFKAARVNPANTLKYE